MKVIEINAQGERVSGICEKFLNENLEAVNEYDGVMLITKRGKFYFKMSNFILACRKRVLHNLFEKNALKIVANTKN